MKNTHLYTGAYENGYFDISVLEHIKDTINLNIEEKSEIYDCYPYTDATIFLKGVCNIFAYYLAQTYKNYKIYTLVKNKQAIHWFCLYESNNKNYYIDVRGITDDKDLFLSNFKDSYIGNEEVYPLDADDKEYPLYSELCIFAKHIINKYNQFYNIHLYE